MSVDVFMCSCVFCTFVCIYVCMCAVCVHVCLCVHVCTCACVMYILYMCACVYICECVYKSYFHTCVSSPGSQTSPRRERRRFIMKELHQMGGAPCPGGGYQPDIEECNLAACLTFEWDVGSWSHCYTVSNNTCGWGLKERSKCLSVCLSLCLSVCLFVCLHIYLQSLFAL